MCVSSHISCMRSNSILRWILLLCLIKFYRCQVASPILTKIIVSNSDVNKESVSFVDDLRYSNTPQYARYFSYLSVLLCSFSISLLVTCVWPLVLECSTDDIRCLMLSCYKNCSNPLSMNW